MIRLSQYSLIGDGIMMLIKGALVLERSPKEFR